MMNQIILVGRLTQDPKVEELENNKKVSYITLAVNRPYKNADGIYETDFIDCVLENSTAENTAEYCRKGDLVGIKGRLLTHIYETENQEKIKTMKVYAERVTFLANNK